MTVRNPFLYKFPFRDPPPETQIMIGISKLYCGTVEPSDALRYGRQSERLPSHLLQFSKDKKPVVVWNTGRRCNLRCMHCYSGSDNQRGSNELNRAEGLALIDDLAGYGVPVILFSGGEPLLRPDLLELITHARRRGIRAVLSTNGTLITRDMAARLQDAGVAYVGISLDGIGATHDRFRGVPGAFSRALKGIRHCLEADLKVGLRLTISRRNAREIDAVFDLIAGEGIPRVCFYHLVYAGRGSRLVAEDLPRPRSRQAVELIMNRTRALHEAGNRVEVLTVDNHCDGPAVYLRLGRERNERAGRVLELLKMNGGNGSGIGIGCISWDGTVHPDQFWRHLNLGNVRETPFSRLWTEDAPPWLLRLRERKKYLKGRCATCRWLDICNGNLRTRAEAVHGDIWAPDPACYLTDAEIDPQGDLGP